MAVLRVFAVLAFVAVTSVATTDSAAAVKEAQALAKALPAPLQQQWTAKIAQQTKNLTAAEKKLEGQFTGESLKGVTAAFAELDKVEQKILANITAFVKLQSTQTDAIIKNYTSLLTARAASPSTEEKPIHDVRADATAAINSWVPLLASVHQYAAQAFESAVRAQATALSKSLSNPVNDQVRVAITNAGIQLLEVLVQEQNADTFLLTSTQFNSFQNFFQKSEDALIQLLVEAKNKKTSQ
ncbi:uncharacterized protein LOC117652261 [Thrips palmi]|uniref:Uncharacterized protein LOC117652261 n=1 Tax=Thrips palmi TaxID=161013 RepID=A0A6P9A9T3_THRPL|nr:uncharacterized protein LOC117652261 [Thrips palmi]